jgi:hypothetical protein
MPVRRLPARSRTSVYQRDLPVANDNLPPQAARGRDAV